MKNKSTRHKDLNTFKFQPFAERIANVDIDIFHKVKHEYEVENDEEESYFYQSIQKWNLMNSSESYTSFVKELKPASLITLPQLLLRKQEVVDVLLKHLRLKNVLSLQAILDITVAFVKDLRKDFYEFYQSFFGVLIDLLNTKNTEQLEWTFICLAYIFKFLWRPILKDVGIVFKTLLPLLSHEKPEYINNFAAGSFAFVARKVKDRKLFLALILQAIEIKEDGVEGCGRLFFEVINGIDGQFHSCAESNLIFLFESLADDTLPSDILFQILEQIIANISQFIHPQKNELLWKVFCDTIEKFVIDYEKNCEVIELLLKLLGQGIEFKNGKLLRHPEQILKLVPKLLDNPNLKETTLMSITQISILLLLHKNLSQEQASVLIRKILALKQSIFLYFVDNINEFSGFEAMILPKFLNVCLKSQMDRECSRVLSNLILKKSPLCQNGIELLNWKKYPLDFIGKENNLKIEKILLSRTETFQTLDELLFTLICFPHINIQNKTSVTKTLLNRKKNFLENIQKTQTKSINELNKYLFLLKCTIECLIHVEEGQLLKRYFQQILDCLLPICVNKNCINALKMLDLLLTFFREDNEIIRIEHLKNINSVLETNFNSPYHEVRLLTAHLYTFFENLKEFQIDYTKNSEIPNEPWKVFTICFRTESIDSQVQTYRDQLQLLEKLNFDKPQMIMCSQTEFKTIPLRYLCGTLYINFKLLWEPVIQIIETHAHGLTVNVFWDVFGQELKKSMEIQKETENVEKEDCFDLYNDLFMESGKLSNKPDFINYRTLLWQCLNQFSDVAEGKTRMISDLILNLIGREFTYMNNSNTTKCNIKVKTMIEDLEEDKDEDTISTQEYTSKKDSLNVLINCLSVYSKFKSPKSVYREPELYKLYLDLLQHKNSRVQKVALDCLLTYKHKYLIPYKDNLYNLIDDKKYKDELATFRIDTESNLIQEEHRKNFIPIVMKIVFSKMTSKIGLRTGGKASGQFRRNLVVKFMAGCKQDEMLAFVGMIFKFYAQYFDADSEIMIKTISDGIDLEDVVQPKRLQSALNMLGIILEHFGGLMGDQLLGFILKVILVIGAMIRGMLAQKASVFQGYLAILRNLKGSLMKITEEFFSRFQKYRWTSKEINAVFDIIVWPYLDKLNIEGIYSPTNLLRLFVLWGTNPRYFSLLVKHKKADVNQYVLPHVIKLLLNEKSHKTVVNAIWGMVEKLLTLVPDEEEKELIIKVDDVLPIRNDILERIKIDDKLNYGSCILLSEVPHILEKLKKKLESKIKNLNPKELLILSRISELVWEPEISNTILNLLLPVVLKKCNAGEEIVLKFLTTISNLLKNVEEPEKHLKQVSPLFGEVSYALGRKILIEILGTIQKKSRNPHLESAFKLITELNAWDAKWIDQPDFQRRHDAFKEIQNLVESKSIDLSLGILLIYNCYFLIKNNKDLALRENSCYCLRSLCPVLLSRYPNNSKEVDYILNETLFILIKNGIRNRNLDLRGDMISLLGHLSRENPESHFILRDLHRYTNKTDLEVDFFENLTHLQLHRHARALLKFSQITEEIDVALNPRTLTQFVLPIASHYLCNEKYSAKNSLIDSTISCVSMICRVLPWHQYEAILRYYLSKLRYKLEYQKQLVRLIVGILDAFHFDLNKANVLDHPVINPDDQLNVETEKNTDNEDIEIEIADNIGDQDTEEIIEDSKTVKISERITILCKSTATRIIKTIQSVLLPQLHRVLAEFTQYDNSHKSNKKMTSYEKEEEDLLRVPISLALVKLLQRLPKEILEANLPGIFMKLCTFLRSHLESVRRVTRETFQKIIQTLGPEYLSSLLAEITPLMSRGYQVHVLVYTVHGILNCLKDKYQKGDIDKVLITVLNLCKSDIFGNLAEEKEVVKLVAKTSEAKSTKSYDTLQIVAQFISDKCLLDLILPIKEVLQNSHSYKIVHKAQEALRFIVLGLTENTFLSTESLLKFAFGTAAESIPELIPKPKNEEKDKKKLKNKVDCFIIPAMPVGRSGFRLTNVKTSNTANAHLFIEFGLRLCLMLLKKDKLKDESFKAFLDPFVVIFQNCLTSKHVKLSTLTLQCLSWIFKFNLPSMRKNITTIGNVIFEILHKYASSGLTKGENFDLVQSAFKAMSVLVREVSTYKLTTEQLKLLLFYIEQDMNNYERQATAFNLLKCIISRKLIIPEVHEVMEKVSELSITSELDHVRTQSRIVFHQYLMEYPLAEKLHNHIAFYLSQTSYELQYGRESALEMIRHIINTFPEKALKKYSTQIYISLGTRLVNDEVPQCRKIVAECLTLLLTRLSRKDIQSLFDMILLWLKDKQLSHRQLAAQLCGIFIKIEKTLFEKRLTTLMPLVLLQFGLDNKPGRFVRVQRDADLNTENERLRDHYMFQVLQMLLKLCDLCPAFLKRTDDISNLSVSVQKLLGYPHDWVRLAAAQFLGFVLTSIDVNKLGQCICENKTSNGYLFDDPENSIKSLTLDLCDQLQPGNIKSELAEQTVKNLVFIAKVLQKVPLNENDKKLNLLFLVKRMRKIVNSEIVECPKSTVLRNEVFKWIAGVGSVLDTDIVLQIVNHLLAPIVREMLDEDGNIELRQLSKEIAGLFRKKIGIEKYTKIVAGLEQQLSIKRAERKRSRHQLAITDPEIYAKKKIKRHEKKRELKRKMISERKGMKRTKRPKLVQEDEV